MPSKRQTRSCSSPSCVSRLPLRRARSATSPATSPPGAPVSTGTTRSQDSAPPYRRLCRLRKSPNISSASRLSREVRVPTLWSSVITIPFRHGANRSSSKPGAPDPTPNDPQPPVPPGQATRTPRAAPRASLCSLLIGALTMLTSACLSPSQPTKGSSGSQGAVPVGEHDIAELQAAFRNGKPVSPVVDEYLTRI